MWEAMHETEHPQQIQIQKMQTQTRRDGKSTGSHQATEAAGQTTTRRRKQSNEELEGQPAETTGRQ